ncbi:MAG: S41 family peptidase [Chitinophagaceae bacterium]
MNYPIFAQINKKASPDEIFDLLLKNDNSREFSNHEITFMNNPKKLNVFIPLILAAVLALGMFYGYKLRDTIGRPESTLDQGSNIQTLRQIMELINIKYVDSVNDSVLKGDAIRGILNHLDPHSVYIPPSELQQVNNDLDGDFQGIGIEFNIFRDTPNIITVLSNGPSQTAGLETGDEIIQINDSLVAGNHISSHLIRKLITGTNGSVVNLTILRNNQILHFRIKRGIIRISSIDASYMATPDIGYIRINLFGARTYDEFMKSILALKKQGMKKLIIDLRQNPGGFLDAATKIADELLDSNKLIVYAKGKNFPRTNYICEKPGVFEKGKLAILVDEGSASASEILSGAIQDWDRGVIIGRRTFGKGLVQEQYNLNDGGALRLTVARYYMPSGRCIQKPYNHGLAAYEKDMMNRFNHGEFLSADSIKIKDSTRYHTLVKGRIVYGGGGITPDIFIPFDTIKVDHLFDALYSRNTMNRFVYDFYIHHKSNFASFKGPQDFEEHFHLPSSLMAKFISYAIADSVLEIKEMTPPEKMEVGQRLKALLGRQLWQNQGYFLISNSYDSAFKAAIQELNQ